MDRWYVGHKGGRVEVFQAPEKPTQSSHGRSYAACTGPFRTKRAAVFMATNGRNNPHCVTVADAERLARRIG